MKLKQLYHKLHDNWRFYSVYGFMILVLILIIMYFHINLFSIFITLLLMIIASFSKIYKRFTSLSLGFELITPVMILFCYKYGILFSLITAIIMLFLAAFIAGNVDFMSITVEVIVYTILAFLITAFHAVPFVPLAVVMVIMRNILAAPLVVLFLGRHPIHLIIIVGTDIILNIWVVLTFGNLFVTLL